ncbi:microtubule associated protein 1S [Homo sapiens]|uniref:Microtubule associated protein 1S n=1 Tax=Homo sapiens TaxID=9606 RepID=M0QX37_HUMAN|nr:microtubule associated protein 1S [Homo sapiens]KAI4041305.1 microtubule associated protein 1S [Homo sapiens]
MRQAFGQWTQGYGRDDRQVQPCQHRSGLGMDPKRVRRWNKLPAHMVSGRMRRLQGTERTVSLSTRSSRSLCPDTLPPSPAL